MPTIEIGHVKGSHARLRPTLAGLTDAAALRPSRLTGWSVAHVLTHLARNADSHVGLLDAAARGQVGDQYPGGNEQRSADIEAGASRPAVELVEDALRSATRLEDAWAATPDDVWRTGHARVVSGIWPLAELPFRRWREVEVHHVDLGLGYSVADWPDVYVVAELAQSIAGLPGRLAPRTSLDIRATDTGEQWLVEAGDGDAARATAPVIVDGERRSLLAWLIGRGGDDRSDVPVLGPWAG